MVEGLRKKLNSGKEKNIPLEKLVKLIGLES